MGLARSQDSVLKTKSLIKKSLIKNDRITSLVSAAEFRFRRKTGRL
jgi:hypothetical protein